MELSPRKKAVLSAVIKNYIETGEPVGSKILTELLENAPSSATLRNEMSELCALGFLSQPHTSAGRVPTSAGLSLYINKLMPKGEIAPEAKSFIDERIRLINCDTEKIPAEFGKIISDLTGLPAISSFITEKEAILERVELMPISMRSVMLVVITSDSRARNRIFRSRMDFDSTLYEQFNEIIRQKLIGKPISQLNKPYMQSVIVGAGLNALSLMPLLTAVFELVGEIENMSVDLSGESRLYNISADEASARKIISLIKNKAPIISLMNDIKEGVGVIFGSDTVFGELSSEIIVAAAVDGVGYKGSLAVIGPKRISYEQVIPSIEYAAERLGFLLSETMED